MPSLLAYPWQSWKGAKAVAILVVLAFAIGVGSATAIYTVIHALLLKPIPFEHGERFVSVLGATFDDPKGLSSVTMKDALEYQQRARSFDLFGWFVFNSYNLTAPGEPQFVNGVEVTPALVNGIGVNPRLGRWFTDASVPAAVLSHDLWVRLGADPAMVGKTVTLNGRAYTVTGVMPPGFNLPLPGTYSEAQMQVWLPLDPLGRGQNREVGDTFCYARLRPGVTLAQASAEVKAIAADIARREPASHPAYTARVDDLREMNTKTIRPILYLLFGASGLLLIITCANVGGLLVSRAVARARETAVRVALGAGLGQLAAQYFLEGSGLAVAGAAGAMLLTFAVMRLLVAFGGEQNTRLARISIDWTVVAFALATALLTAVAASMAPLWQAARMLPNAVLSEGVRASAGLRSRHLSRALVVSEVALAFVLLVLTTVLVAESYRLARVQPGFDPDHLLTFEVTVAEDSIPGKVNRREYQDRLTQALEAIPGVSGVGFVNQLPLAGCCFVTTIYPDGLAANPRAPDRVSFYPANPGYFAAMKIPLRKGRFFDARDTGETPLPAVIDEAAAKRYWPGRDPVGLIGHFGTPKGNPFQVLGIVGDLKNNGLDNNTVPEIYLPSAVVGVNPMNFIIRSELPPRALVPAVLRAIHLVNPAQPIHDVRTMRDILRDSLAMKRAASYVMTFFGFAALLMATIGAYGLVSYSVRQRTVEFGTRMALGALPGDLLRLVLGSGMKMAGWGIAAGGMVSVAVTFLLVRNFEINIGNGGTGRLENPGVLPFLAATCLVGLVVAGSSFFPALWATLLSPMVAIRDQPGGRGSLRTSLQRPHPLSDQNADPALVRELIDASRRSSTYQQAILAALESVRERTGAERILLLENSSGEEFRTTAAVPGTAVLCSLPARGLLMNRLRRYDGPLPLTRADVDTWRRWAVENGSPHLPEITALNEAEIRLAVPLRTKNEIAGVLLLGPPLSDLDYEQPAIRLLQGCADQFALLLENARLTGRVLEQEKLRRDVALAADVQKRLLARQSLENDTVSIAAVSIPARSVGGDYFDLLELDGGRTGIALADVAGKGVPAALIMSAVQATVRVLSAEPSIALSVLVTRMNEFLHKSTGPSSYATFFYAQVDERNRTLTYVNAGHNPPYFVRLRAGSLAIEELSAGGTVVGLFPKARYEEVVVGLEPNDTLLIFTDGVPEALNPQDEEFGEDRLKAALQRTASLPVQEIVSQISGELKIWIQDAEQYDDVTLVVMKVR